MTLWEAEIVVFWHRQFEIKWVQNLLTTPLWGTIEWAWDIIEQRSGYVESSTRVGLSNAHWIVYSRHLVAEQWPHHLHFNFEVAFRFKKKASFKRVCGCAKAPWTYVIGIPNIPWTPGYTSITKPWPYITWKWKYRRKCGFFFKWVLKKKIPCIGLYSI